jgi:hypothetical protein
MQPGYFCVAGVDLELGRQTRPVIRVRPFRGFWRWLWEMLVPSKAEPARPARLATNLLQLHGGPFDFGKLVNIGPVRPVPEPPETEDVVFEPGRARAERTLASAELWELLGRDCREDLRAVFGADLQPRGSGAVVEIGRGQVSLGCLAPSQQPRLALRARGGQPGGVRLRLVDRGRELDLSLADIRCYGQDHVTPDPAVFADLQRRLAAGVPVLLSIGLTRPYSSNPGVDPPFHWLQVNNIHLADEPV